MEETDFMPRVVAIDFGVAEKREVCECGFGKTCCQNVCVRANKVVSF